MVREPWIIRRLWKRSKFGRSADLKWGKEKTLTNRGVGESGEIGNYDRRQDTLNQGRRSPMAAIGRCLEDTVGVAGKRGAPIMAAMATGIRAMGRLLI